MTKIERIEELLKKHREFYLTEEEKAELGEIKMEGMNEYIDAMPTDETRKSRMKSQVWAQEQRLKK